MPLPRKRARQLRPASRSDQESPDPQGTHDVEGPLTAEYGAIESLFTPEGIEFVNAAQAAKPSRPAKRRRTPS